MIMGSPPVFELSVFSELSVLPLSVLSDLEDVAELAGDVFFPESEEVSFSTVLPLLRSFPQSLQYVSPVYPSAVFVAAFAFLISVFLCLSAAVLLVSKVSLHFEQVSVSVPSASQVAALVTRHSFECMHLTTLTLPLFALKLNFLASVFIA